MVSIVLYMFHIASYIIVFLSLANFVSQYNKGNNSCYYVIFIQNQH